MILFQKDKGNNEYAKSFIFAFRLYVHFFFFLNFFLLMLLFLFVYIIFILNRLFYFTTFLILIIISLLLSFNFYAHFKKNFLHFNNIHTILISSLPMSDSDVKCSERTNDTKIHMFNILKYLKIYLSLSSYLISRPKVSLGEKGNE